MMNMASDEFVYHQSQIRNRSRNFYMTNIGDAILIFKLKCEIG